MKTYIAYKEDSFGNPLYLKEDGNFTYDEKEAKEYKKKWWIELIYLLLDLLINWGIDIKIKKK